MTNFCFKCGLSNATKQQGPFKNRLYCDSCYAAGTSGTPVATLTDRDLEKAGIPTTRINQSRHNNRASRDSRDNENY